MSPSTHMSSGDVKEVLLICSSDAPDAMTFRIFPTTVSFSDGADVPIPTYPLILGCRMMYPFVVDAVISPDIIESDCETVKLASPPDTNVKSSDDETLMRPVEERMSRLPEERMLRLPSVFVMNPFPKRGDPDPATQGPSGST